jgi:creatinine amidohydrolase/Fe(II)-dependent formamide hydrolase-like protein
VLIVNGHGGNRGVLEALVQQFQRKHDAVSLQRRLDSSASFRASPLSLKRSSQAARDGAT